MMFTDDTEAWKWAKRKWDSSISIHHPDKDHESNWKLHERWFKAELGKDSSQETRVEEVLSRDAKDVSAASSALAWEPAKAKAREQQRDTRQPYPRSWLWLQNWGGQSPAQSRSFHQ